MPVVNYSPTVTLVTSHRERSGIQALIFPLCTAKSESGPVF